MPTGTPVVRACDAARRPRQGYVRQDRGSYEGATSLPQNDSGGWNCALLGPGWNAKKQETNDCTNSQRAHVALPQNLDDANKHPNVTLSPQDSPTALISDRI